MAGVIASKVRKQRSALKADASRDAETQNNYLNVGNVYFLRLFWIHFFFEYLIAFCWREMVQGKKKDQKDPEQSL